MRVTAQTKAAIAEAAWAMAQRLGTFGYAKISAELNISMDRATEIVRGWEAEGAVRRTVSGVRTRNMFAVNPAFVRRPDPAALGSVVQNLWTSMCGLKSFTPTDLAAHSDTGTVKVSVEAARGYCQVLLRAGYLKVERTAIPGRRDPIYRLIRKTGPRPPRERRVRAVFDDNLGELVHVSGVAK